MKNRLYPFQGPRLLALAGVMILSFALLIMRLYQLQIVEYSDYKTASEANSLQRVLLPAARGAIYDRYGRPLALNAAAFNITIVPAELPGDEAQALTVLNRLAALIDVPATRAAAIAAGKATIRSLEDQVNDGAGTAPYRPVVVATDVTPPIAMIIMENIRQLPGIHVESSGVRQYPTGELTSQIVGYLGPISAADTELLRSQGLNPQFQRIGYAGVEAYLEDDLAGQRGTMTQVVDVAGLPIRVVNRVEPVAGKNVRLTIDIDLQRAATEILQDQINLMNAEANAEVTRSGVVVAIDPRTGEILAMVSLPTYDNAKFARFIDAPYYMRIAAEPQTPLQNHAIQSLYPPGSVWKLISATAALNENVIAYNAKLFDAGILTVENSFAANDVKTKRDFVCWLRSGHKEVDMIRGIAWSCDVYFYQIGGGNPAVSPTTLKPGGLGIDNLIRYATAYSIGVDLGIELPAEVSGRMPDRDWKRRNYGESWSTGDTYNAAFGQGYVTVTPLQLLMSSAAIASSGMLYQPTIIKEWIDEAGNVVTPFQAHLNRTLSLPTDGSPVYLNMREDMYIQGKNSLACTCEPDSPYRNKDSEFYDPNMPACDENFKSNYTGKLTIQTVEPQTGNVLPQQDITYKVNVPYAYIFNGAPYLMCDPNRIAQNRNYQPPFINPQYWPIVEEGMHEATTITGGTALPARLGYVEVGGKTGTAEYCDEIAAKQLLCISGKWPAHAWYFGYAPYSQDRKPEIAIIAFIYNGKEGSANALPVVKGVMHCYYTLKDQRKQAEATGQPFNPNCNWREVVRAR